MTASSARAPARRWQVLDGTALKLLYMALMTADHIHQMFAPAGAPLWLTILGRPVFPLFLFAAAEGFHYTRSRRRYLLRLLLASWGMTLLTTALQQAVPEPGVVLMNNAFSTFFVTGVYIQSWDWLTAGLRARRSGLVRRPGLVLRGLLAALLPLAGMLPALAAGVLSFREDVPLAVLRGLAFLSLLLPNPLLIEGGPAMAALGVLFYIFRKNRAAQVAALGALTALVWLRRPGDIQCWMAAAALPMLLYNGRPGRGWKPLFYLYYPAHIAALYLAAALF